MWYWFGDLFVCACLVGLWFYLVVWFGVLISLVLIVGRW